MMFYLKSEMTHSGSREMLISQFLYKVYFKRNMMFRLKTQLLLDLPMGLKVFRISRNLLRTF